MQREEDPSGEGTEQENQPQLEISKSRRAKRIQQKERHINRQLAIRKRSGWGPNKTDPKQNQPHRMAKKCANDCGKSNCMICGNPRRSKLHKTDQLTIQEKKAIEYEKSFDDLDE